MGNEVKLSIEIKNTHPVELADLTQSLNSLAAEYKSFLSQSQVDIDPEKIKLYVKEIKAGSIITELTPYLVYTLPLFEYSATIISYAEHLKTVYDFLLGKNKEPLEVVKNTLQNASNILEPVAKDSGAQMNIGAVNVNGDITVNVKLDSLEANAIQNFAKREMEKLKEPDTGIHSRVLMYLYQARNDLASQAGDRTIIESISTSAIKTIFLNDRIKSKILHDEPNPFKKGFIVDVSVETIQGIPKVYKVIDLYDTVDRD